MTIKQKRIKSLFGNFKHVAYIVAVVVMTILIAISCKKKPTQVSASQIVDEPISTNETPQPIRTNEDVNKPVLSIDNKANMDQFNGLYFESKAYELNDNFKFTAKVGIENSGNKKGVAYIQFEDGCKFYQVFQVGDYNGIYDLLYSGSRNGLSYVKAKARFTEEGYLYVKFENYSWEIEYALAEEPDGTYDVGVVYPEINGALISQLDKIWKNFVNDGDKRLYVTTTSATTADNVKTYSHSYFTFNSDGNMVLGDMNHVNPADRGKVIKTFVKAVTVKVNGGYVIGGLYKINDFKLSSIQDLKTAIVDSKVAFSLNAGNYEIVYVNPASSYKGGYGYSIIGSYSSTKDLDVSNFIKPEDYSDKLPNTINGLNPKSYNYTRVYRIN